MAVVFCLFFCNGFDGFHRALRAAHEVGAMPSLRAVVVMTDKRAAASPPPPLPLALPSHGASSSLPVFEYESLIAGEAASFEWPSDIPETAASSMCYTRSAREGTQGARFLEP